MHAILGSCQPQQPFAVVGEARSKEYRKKNKRRIMGVHYITNKNDNMAVHPQHVPNVLEELVSFCHGKKHQEGKRWAFMYYSNYPCLHHHFPLVVTRSISNYKMFDFFLTSNSTSHLIFNPNKVSVSISSTTLSFWVIIKSNRQVLGLINHILYMYQLQWNETLNQSINVARKANTPWNSLCGTRSGKWVRWGEMQWRNTVHSCLRGEERDKFTAAAQLLRRKQRFLHVVKKRFVHEIL
jgi:hypothetical protein